MKRLPKGWREGHASDLACPHRDVSVCPLCAKRPEVMLVAGMHMWVPSPAERRQIEEACGPPCGASGCAKARGHGGDHWGPED
jgi:hypothetical protein